MEHLLHLNKGRDGLSPCFAPVFFIVKCVKCSEGVKRRLRGQVLGGLEW